MTPNLCEVFHETARRQPDHPAILGPAADAAMTYGRLDEAIVARAEELRRAGLQSGQCVGLHYPSGVDYITLTYASWRCGACVVPIPIELAAEEKREIFREIALDFLISPATTASLAEPFRRGEPVPLSGGPTLLSVQSPCDRPAGFDAVDGAFIRFTSGTTGNSKGIVLSHRSILDRITAANEALRLGAPDRVVWILSMSYHFTVSIVSYLSFGTTIVLPANHFAAAIVDAAQRHRASVIYASAAHCELLADYQRYEPLPRLRLMISTTSSLDGEVARRFHARYGVPVVQALGIIEVGLPCINLEFAAEKTGSVGRVLPAYEMRLDDQGLGPGTGEVLFRGKGFLDAYYRPWRTRDEILFDGWFNTGDVGRVDSDGCLFLQGRCKDVINVMGMKFFPREVEAVLQSHADVQEACVTARHHPRMGETPHARVVVKNGRRRDGLEEELRQWCGRSLAAYKVPESIELVDFLPRTASGKVLHRDGGVVR
jgi:long-chain acyl-CoA synthetase